MADLRIRAATADDAERLAAVYRSAYAENRRHGFPASAESATERDDAAWIREKYVAVAAVDGEIVGGVRLDAIDPDRVKLTRLGVHDDWKGGGVGTALLEHAEEWTRERDRDTIRLTTPGEHPHLPAFYRDRGYEKTGPYPLDDREYDEIVMEKRLR